MAVYTQQGARSLPLVLAASKSWVGHAEPAAGLAGLLFAQQAAVAQRSLALLHLRAVNPYVASTLDENRQAQVLLPKQGGGLPNPQPHNSVLGVSAFAFQGTNAHAVVQPAPLSLEAGRFESHLTWDRRRHYVVPAANLLIHQALVAGRKTVTLECNLMASQLSFLWDHQVLGKSIFPGRYNFFHYD
jgi:acyl transferase domain-containing protein